MTTHNQTSGPAVGEALAGPEQAPTDAQAPLGTDAASSTASGASVGLDVPLFAGYEPKERGPEPKLSQDQRRTKRQAEAVAAGRHPLTGGRLHELASRHRDATSPKADPFTCGSCWFRELFRPGNRQVAKCTFGLTNEHKYVTQAPRISGSVATDVRAWWPACPDYSPSDRLSSDAARYVPEVSA